MKAGIKQLGLLLLAGAGVLLGIQGSRAQGVPAPGAAAPYAYRYKGQLVSMQPSTGLVALHESGDTVAAFAAGARLRRLPVSNGSGLKEHGLGVYRLPAAGKGSAVSTASSLFRNSGGSAPVQPVFEMGDSLVIPKDEALVGFKNATSLAAARRFLGAHGARLGLASVAPYREKIFLVRIQNPADGRVFQVCQAISRLGSIWYAEPNFVQVRRQASDFTPQDLLSEPLQSTGFTRAPLASPAGGSRDSGFNTLANPNWVTLLSEGFEGSMPGWTTGHAPGFAAADPAVTTFRARSGGRSAYMTGAGAQGVAAPGPYPINSRSFLETPPMALAPYEEAYVEFWFYAKYEAPTAQIWDYARLGIYDANTGQGSYLSAMIVAYTGDLTVDPTTQSGWRRVLARVPPSLRSNSAVVQFSFNSDDSNGAEGVYIDDVRVVGSTDVDTESLGNDPYSARQYELKNSGQLAGLGSDTTDLNVPEALAAVSVSSNIVVAVIDTGVDLAHPDLNLVTGYNASNGSVGGGPTDSTSSHGTQCAGNVGAKRDNGIGVMGTAPGVKIMPINQGNTSASFANGFDLARQNGARVISCSWLSPLSTTLETAINNALNANCVVLFAAGNGPDRPPYTYDVAYPARLTATTNIICVGGTSPTDEHKNASSSDGQFSWGSSYVGAGPDVCAPAPWSYTTDIRGAGGSNTDATATGIHGDYSHDFGGTSSATPKVAGIVALLLSKNPSLTPAQVKQILRNSARDIDAAGEDDRTGKGRVDALAALNAVPSTGGTLTVTAPNGGESWAAGSSQTITWTSSGVNGNVKLEYSTDGGANWNVISGNSANDGTEPWTVPATATTQGRVRVSSVDAPTVLDSSNANFSITGVTTASITVTSPNGGESWAAGSVQSITWTSSNVTGNVKLEYSLDGGGSWTVISGSTANDGSEPWTTPATATTQGVVRVSSVSAPTVFDTSNAGFTLTAPSGPQGDLNRNSRIDVGDVQIIVNVFIGRTAYDPALHDLDGSGVKDIGDVNWLIDRFLGLTSAASAFGNSPEARAKVFKQSFHNGGQQITALSFDIIPGRGQTVLAVARGGATDDITIAGSRMANGRSRVLLLSRSATPIPTAANLILVKGTLKSLIPLRTDSTTRGAEGSDPNGTVVAIPYSTRTLTGLSIGPKPPARQ